MPKKPTVAATCAAIEQYLDRLLHAKIAGLDVRAAVLAPQKAGALASAGKRLGAPLPADLRAFLARGLRHPEGSLEEPFASVGFSFLGAKQIAEHTAMLRKIAKDTIEDPTDEHAALVNRGVAVTYEEPELLVAPDGVYHFSFRNSILRVASSWTEFLEHWLAAGCFSSHAFDPLWSRVKTVVGGKLPPSRNFWVRAYKKQFPSI